MAHFETRRNETERDEPNPDRFVARISVGFAFLCFASKSTYLHGDDGRQEDVVQRLGFHADIDLLDTVAQASHQLLHGTNDKAQTGLGKPAKLSPCFDDADLGGANGKTADAHVGERWIVCLMLLASVAG